MKYIATFLTTVLFAAAGVEINTGVMWKDEAGNDITAHGGCVIKVGKSFY